MAMPGNTCLYLSKYLLTGLVMYLYMQFPQPALSYVVKYWNILNISTRINEPEITNLAVVQYIGWKDKNCADNSVPQQYLRDRIVIQVAPSDQIWVKVWVKWTFGRTFNV